MANPRPVVSSSSPSAKPLEYTASADNSRLQGSRKVALFSFNANRRKLGRMAILIPYKGVMPTIHPQAFVAENAVIIGDVTIGPQTGIWYGCVLRGDVNIIRIGARTNIQDGTVIHVSRAGKGTHVGNGITVGHMALLHDCTLHDDSFVGMQACVMDGAEVSHGGMVAAGALVTPGKKVPTGQLWAGNPAKFMRDLKPEEQEMIAKSAEHYVRLAAEYHPAVMAG